MQHRGLVAYDCAQYAVSLKAAQKELGDLGLSLNFFHYSYFRGFPRRPKVLARFALQEIRILRALRSGSYSFAIIPAQIERSRLLAYFLRTARKHRVDVYMYWHDCRWILGKVRDLVGEHDFERFTDLLEAYQPQHLVVSPSAFADAHRVVGIQEAHCVWNATPRTPVHKDPDNDPPIIVNVASVQLRKAPELFVDIAQYVCARHPTVKFVWVGGGSISELRSYLRAAGLHERVAFVGWSDDPGTWISRSSALLLTSRSEAFGLGVAQAMATARTVIAFAGTGASDALKDSGIVVQRYDTVAAAETILAILERPVGDRINSSARQRYEAMFSPEAFAKRLAGVLKGRSEVVLTVTNPDAEQSRQIERL